MWLCLSYSQWYRSFVKYVLVLIKGVKEHLASISQQYGLFYIPSLFQISSGPNIGLKLKGIVTMPDLQLSSDSIDFDAVVCGQCKVVTIQMFNYTQVRYDLSLIYSECLRAIDVISYHPFSTSIAQ